MRFTYVGVGRGVKRNAAKISLPFGHRAQRSELNCISKTNHGTRAPTARTVSELLNLHTRGEGINSNRPMYI